MQAKKTPMGVKVGTSILAATIVSGCAPVSTHSQLRTSPSNTATVAQKTDPFQVTTANGTVVKKIQLSPLTFKYESNNLPTTDDSAQLFLINRPHYIERIECELVKPDGSPDNTGIMVGVQRQLKNVPPEDPPLKMWVTRGEDGKQGYTESDSIMFKGGPEFKEEGSLYLLDVKTKSENGSRLFVYLYVTYLDAPEATGKPSVVAQRR